MGCCSSSAASLQPAAYQEANRQFFGLGELPVTITSHVQGAVLHVRVGGLDQPGLLAALEQGFVQRHFWIEAGTASAESGLFHGIFHLLQQDSMQDQEAATPQGDEELTKPPSKQVTIVPLPLSDASPSKAYVPYDPDNAEGPRLDGTRSTTSTASRPRRRSLQTMFLGNVDGVQANTGLEEADARASAQGACVRFTVTRRWSLGLRVALHRMVEVAGFRVKLARICTSRRWGWNFWIEDTLWLAPNEKLKGELNTSAFDWRDLPPWMQTLVERLETSHVEHSVRSCMSFVDLRDLEDRVNTCAEKSASDHLDAIPKCLQQKALELPYWLAPSKVGLDFSNEGISKFTGAGMTKSYHGDEVLEFCTYYAPHDLQRSPSKQGRFRQTLGSLASHDKRFAEFVTQYSPKSKTLTIFKVFLNGVLPAGRNAGVAATAEQMLCIPVQTIGTLDAVWDGAAAVSSLTAIWLCDAVNWNTYCLMSMVGKDPSCDTEDWLLNGEVKASRITRQQLKEGTPTEVFKVTVLGKVVTRILAHWQRQGVAQLEIDEVRIHFDSNELEFIFGEFRRMMDIEVILRPIEGVVTL